MGVRTYTLQVENDQGAPISLAQCYAYDASDLENMVLVETQESDGTGKAYFVALPDTARVDIEVIWGKNVKWYRNVLSVDGDSVDTAVGQSHARNGDDYAAGVKVVTEFPADPVEGETVIL